MGKNAVVDVDDAALREAFEPIVGRKTIHVPTAWKKVSLQTEKRLSDRERANRKAKFLSLVQAGRSKFAAARHIRVSPAVVEKWMADDPSFNEAYLWAEEVFTDYLEEMAKRRASESDTILMKMLAARRPDVYGKQEASGGGGVTVVINTDFGRPDIDQPITIETAVEK